jgi:hypothetical protein
MTRSEARALPMLTFHIYLNGRKVSWISAKTEAGALKRAQKMCPKGAEVKVRNANA